MAWFEFDKSGSRSRYTKSPIAGGQLPLFEVKGLKQKGKEPFKIELNEVTDTDADGAVWLTDVKWLLKNNANIATSLKGNGDFRSEECLKLLKEADIVVTNPPFSLFREYVEQLVEHKKKFIILGDQNGEIKLWEAMRNVQIESKQQILERRKELEQELVNMLKETKSNFTSDHVRDAISH